MEYKETMKETYYLEIIEQLTEDEALTKQPQVIRVEVKSEAEARALLPNYESAFKGLNCVKQLHIHRHSPGTNRPCKLIPL